MGPVLEAAPTDVVVKPGIGHVDALITGMVLPTLPLWKQVGASPNLLTTFGAVASFGCAYCLLKRRVAGALVLLATRVYFDYADGLMARKYDMKSKFGDYYDHVNDVTFTAMVASILALSRYDTNTKLRLLGVLAVFSGLFLVNMGCIEAAYHGVDATDTSISRLRCLCPDDRRVRDASKFFDNGTLYVVLAVVFVLFCRAGRGRRPATARRTLP